MRFRTPIILAVVLLLAFLLGQRVFLAIQNTFHKPPVGARADKSTPNEQNVFDLREIQPVNQQNSYNYTSQGPQKMGGMNGALEADIGLWIKMDAASQSLGSGCESSYNSPCAKQLSVTGQSSTGDTFPLPWKTMSDASHSATAPMLLAIIPAGYPDTYQWVDVSVDDKQGHKALWRITHLPPSQHVLSPPVALQKTFKQGNITATARAYRGQPPYNQNGPGDPRLLCDLNGTIAGASHQSELGEVAQTLEWEPPGYAPHKTGITFGIGSGSKNIPFGFKELPVYQDEFNQRLPYLKDQHFVRLTAQLQQFETYDEKVTFHNIPLAHNKNVIYLAPARALSLTTLSGLTVTLPAGTEQRVDTADAGTFGVDDSGMPYPHKTKFGINFVLRLDPEGSVAALPQSPLWRKFRKPVSISSSLAEPLEERGSFTRGNSPTVHYFHAPAGTTNVLQYFPIIVRQRVDLQAVPMTFTLPIEDK